MPVAVHADDSRVVKPCALSWYQCFLLSFNLFSSKTLTHSTNMKTQTFLLSLVGAVTVGAAPFAVERAGDRGSYEVSGLGSRKQEILKAGGSTLDIAIAMLESDTMQADYAYGQSASPQ